MYGQNRYSPSYSTNQYKTNSVNTSPLQLVVMCYDGMIRFMGKAKEAIEKKDIVNKVKFINKTLAIVDELQNSLDFRQGGEVARNLDRIYDYFNNELMKVSMKDDLEILAHLLTLTRDLRSAWAEIANNNPSLGNNRDQGVTITG